MIMKVIMPIYPANTEIGPRRIGAHDSPTKRGRWNLNESTLHARVIWSTSWLPILTVNASTANNTEVTIVVDEVPESHT